MFGKLGKFLNSVFNNYFGRIIRSSNLRVNHYFLFYFITGFYFSVISLIFFLGADFFVSSSAFFSSKVWAGAFGLSALGFWASALNVNIGNSWEESCFFRNFRLFALILGVISVTLKGFLLIFYSTAYLVTGILWIWVGFALAWMMPIVWDLPDEIKNLKLLRQDVQNAIEDVKKRNKF